MRETRLIAKMALVMTSVVVDKLERDVFQYSTAQISASARDATRAKKNSNEP